MTTLTTLPASPATSDVDLHGNRMTGSREAIAAYDRALDRLLRFDVQVMSSLEELTTEHPEAPMTHVFGAYLCLTSTDTATLEDARAFAHALDALARNEREEAHASAIRLWLAGQWHAAARALDDLLLRWPTDLLALAVGQQLDFAVGDAPNMRDRIGRSLGALGEGHPHHAFVLGMHALGLEECGTYDAAEEAGMAALASHPDDVWAVHAVAHVHEMRGDIERGIDFMASRMQHWGDGNVFAVHLWWHLAIYQLELGRIDDVLDIYDARIHNAESQGVPLEMLDASALLWRLHLDGIDVGTRFGALADGWTTRTEAAPWYVFNDVHATMALAGAGRLTEARAMVDRLARSLSDESIGRSNRTMTAEAGLPAARAILAQAEGRHGDVVAELLPARRRLISFGGSNAARRPPAHPGGRGHPGRPRRPGWCAPARTPGGPSVECVRR